MALISAHSKTISGDVSSGEYVLIFGPHRTKQDSYETFTMDLEGNTPKIINYSVNFIK